MGLKMAGVDILRTNHGPVVLEVNSSPGLEGIEKATEVDVAGKIVAHCARHAHETPDPGRGQH
jgi:ribosomal protein S6--L-glutamate ligase